MNGWLIIFGGIAATSGLFAGFSQGPAAFWFASGIFGVLFLLALAISTIRRLAY
jgi:hypothetical protein